MASVHTQQSDVLPAAQLAVEYDLRKSFVYLLYLNLAKREKQAIFGKRNWILSLLLNAHVEVGDFSHPSLPAPSFVYTSVYISSVVEQVYFLSTCFLLLLFFEKFFKE